MSSEELRFVVLGKTGNGKSSSVNTIVGQNVCRATASSQSVTKQCQLVEEVVRGKRLVIVDTPGLYDTESTEDETRKEIGKIIGLTSPGFHAFIVVIRIGRFTREEIRSIYNLAEIFGPELYDRALVLCTGVDYLEADGETFADYLKKAITVDLQDFIKKCEDRVVGFNNRNHKDTCQVEKLMNTIGDIVKAKRNSYYTNEMYEKAKQILEEEENRRLQKDPTKSRSCVRQEIRHDIATETSYGKELLQFLIHEVAIPFARLLANAALQVAADQIENDCILS